MNECLNKQMVSDKKFRESEVNMGCDIQNNANLKASEEKNEAKSTRKGKSKDKIYTIKTVIDKNIGTDWYNQKVYKKSIPSNDCISKQISNILNGSNLNTLTLRKLFGILSMCFNVNLSSIDIPNISQIIKDYFCAQKNSGTSQEVRKTKRAREKKKILIRSLAELMDGNETASLKACAIRIKQYCEENHLIHPSNAKLFTLDVNLQEIFPGRESISRQVNEILAILRTSNVEVDTEQNLECEFNQNNPSTCTNLDQSSA